MSTMPHRMYSSSSAGRSPKDEEESSESAGEGSSRAQSPGSAPFGFQSLSSLFEQPPQGRYSRPREPTAAAPSVGLTTRKDAAEVDAEKPTLKPEFFAGSDSYTEEPPTGRDLNLPIEGSATPRIAPPSAAEAAPLSTGSGDSLPKSATGEAKPLSGKRRRMYAARRRKRLAAALARSSQHARQGSTNEQRKVITKHASAGTSSGLLPNPFAASTPRQGNAGEQGMTFETERTVDRPWGLNPDDIDASKMTSDSIANIGGTKLQRDNRTKATEFRYVPQNEIAKTERPAERLTHLNSSGEAHMVDVGAKPATRRIAVAMGLVRFSNAQPLRQILENTNKKGDVLSVARIAGIMASKRTADLIPLCHPIPISKVEIDLLPYAPETLPKTLDTALNNVKSKHGIVVIQAVVEAVGPTGVEMEALSAVSGAALTVYDMCKAVDKDMQLFSNRVCYKSGGQSGLYFRHRWAHWLGRDWFEKRKLEVPNRAFIEDVRGVGN